METITDTAADLADVRSFSLASLGSLAGAGVLDSPSLPLVAAGVPVAAFSSSI